MTDADRFERRFAAGLRDYAAEAPIDADVAGIARMAIERPAAGQRWVGLGSPGAVRGRLGWLAVGALLAILTLLAALALGSRRPSLLVVDATQQPSTQAPATPFTGSIQLVAGQRFVSAGFTEPFEFEATILDPVWGSVGTGWATQPGMWVITAAAQFWQVRFFDDWPIWADPCDVGGQMLPDIPATIEGVADWLGSAPRLLIRAPTELPVDGRVAMRFELRVEEPCAPGAAALLPGYGLDRVRPIALVYAIPTGDDLILAVLFSDVGSRPDVLENANSLVGSITFD